MKRNEINKKLGILDKKIVLKLKERPGKEIYESDLLVLGLIARSKSLYHGLNDAHSKSNPYVFAILYRAQIETLATINYLIEKPQKVKSFLHGGRNQDKYRIPNILTLIDLCKPKYPAIRDIYNEVSEIAHPNSSSHFLSTKMKDTEKNIFKWSSMPSFSKQELKTSLRDMLELNTSIIKDLDTLIDKIMK